MAWLKARDPEEPLIPLRLAGIIVGLSPTLAVAAVSPLGIFSEFAYMGGRLASLVAPQVAKNNPLLAGQVRNWLGDHVSLRRFRWSSVSGMANP